MKNEMNTMTLQYDHIAGTTRTSGAVILAIILHIAIIALFFNTLNNDRWEELMPPPSVVMALSLESEAKQLTETNIGKTQEVAVASEAKQSEAEAVPMPALPTNEQAEIQVKKSTKQRTEPVIKQEKKQPKQKVVQAQSDYSKSSDAPVTSDATAPKQSQQVAAQFDSDSQSKQDEKKQWEALVLGKLNKYKEYPEDARRRNRIGRPVIEFSVDARGYVLDSELRTKSGTNSLDREALRVLNRAQPLPEPPAEMVKNGRVTVLIPIDFTIETK